MPPDRGLLGLSSHPGLDVASLALAQGDVVWGSKRQAERVAAFEALAPAWG